MTSTGTKLVPAFDFTDPYYGGTSLKITGDLNATNDIRLYQTSHDVTANTSLQLIHKRGATGATAMQVGITFEDAPSTFTYLDAGTSATTCGTSTPAVSTDITVPPTPPLTGPFITSYNPLTGATVIGTSGDWNSLGTSTRDKAFDNDVNTFVNSLDANASTAWCGERARGPGR